MEILTDALNMSLFIYGYKPHVCGHGLLFFLRLMFKINFKK